MMPHIPKPRAMSIVLRIPIYPKDIPPPKNTYISTRKMNIRREVVCDTGSIADNRATPLSTWDTMDSVVPPADKSPMVTPLFSPYLSLTISRSVVLSLK